MDARERRHGDDDGGGCAASAGDCAARHKLPARSSHLASRSHPHLWRQLRRRNTQCCARAFAHLLIACSIRRRATSNLCRPLEGRLQAPLNAPSLQMDSAIATIAEAPRAVPRRSIPRSNGCTISSCARQGSCLPPSSARRRRFTRTSAISHADARLGRELDLVGDRHDDAGLGTHLELDHRVQHLRPGDWRNGQDRAWLVPVVRRRIGYLPFSGIGAMGDGSLPDLQPHSEQDHEPEPAPHRLRRDQGHGGIQFHHGTQLLLADAREQQRRPRRPRPLLREEHAGLPVGLRSTRQRAEVLQERNVHARARSCRPDTNSTAGFCMDFSRAPRRPRRRPAAQPLRCSASARAPT